MTETQPQLKADLRLPELLELFEWGFHHTVEEWEKLCGDTIRTGDSESLHKYREYYERILSGHLQTLDGSLQVSRLHSDHDSIELAARMGALRDQVATHYNSLFPRWQTLDDLECILLAPLTPSKEQLDMIVANYPPPQSWFEETIDPFEPERAS